jgi:hypothetical protein
MGAMLGRIISDYRSVVEVCQQRAVELEISREEIDRLAGFTGGYAGKLLGNGNSVRPKRLWPIGLESILGVLGLKILLIEDEAATARTLARRAPVQSSHQRFGNTSNCKSLIADSTKTANPTYAAHAPVPSAPPVPSPAPKAPEQSHSHLHIIQFKRGGRSRVASRI